MFTAYTWQDWLTDRMDTARPDDKAKKLLDIIGKYKASSDFRYALTAAAYFRGENPTVMQKVVLKGQTVSSTVDLGDGITKEKKGYTVKEVAGNRVPSNIFFHLVTQQNQFLLGNGVTLGDEVADKAVLGLGFDKALQQIGENALIQGVAYGFWNFDHVVPLTAAVDGFSGFAPILDENTGDIMAGIQFWRLGSNKPLNVRVFEPDGVTMYRQEGKKMQLAETDPKRPYIRSALRDAAGDITVDGRNYPRLPIVPLYANTTKTSELTAAIRQKIDLYDCILSDFGDNLERTNDVYWVLNNYGGSVEQIAELLDMIEKTRVVANISDGMTTSSAEPKTFEVPYQARQTALELLRKSINDDFMALDMRELTGGSLTNVAIKTAMTNLNLKADRFEWQCFDFVQAVLSLLGIDTEKIRFKRQQIVNETEVVQNIQTMRHDINLDTALRLNPYIMDEEIEQIKADVLAEQVAGIASMEELDKALDDEETEG